MGGFISLIIFVALMALGFLAGGYAERRHIRSLSQRETELSNMLVTQVKTFPSQVPGERPPQLLVGEVVIATDYLKSFLAGLRNLFGGEVRSFQTLMGRARREAILRILQQAHELGYNAVCNVRLETADVGGSTAGGGKKKGMVMAAILATATAYYAEPGKT